GVESFVGSVTEDRFGCHLSALLVAIRLTHSLAEVGELSPHANRDAALFARVECCVHGDLPEVLWQGSKSLGVNFHDLQSHREPVLESWREIFRDSVHGGDNLEAFSRAHGFTCRQSELSELRVVKYCEEQAEAVGAGVV